MTEWGIDLPHLCGGQFCQLIRAMHPTRDLVFGTSREKYPFKHDREADQRYHRERAFQLIRSILSSSEISKLDEHGKLIHLRISERIDLGSSKFVSREAIKIAEREHRSALMELSEAENPMPMRKEYWDQFINVSGYEEKSESPIIGQKISTGNTIATSGFESSKIKVCPICFHVYRLLGLARKYLAEVNEEVNQQIQSVEKTSLPQSITNNQKLNSCNMNSKMNYGQLRADSYVNPNISSASKRQGMKAQEAQNYKCVTSGKQPISSQASYELADETKMNITPKVGEYVKLKHNSHYKNKKIDLDFLQNNKNKSTMSNKKKTPYSFEKGNDDVINSMNNIEKQTKGSNSHINDKSTHAMNQVEPGIQTGICKYDQSTEFPFTIMDSSFFARKKGLNQAQETVNGNIPRFFNLIVCHDIFDTLERFKIFFKPTLQRYPGVQILLWNYPGQAFTKFSQKCVLNNKFHADCLEKMLYHISSEDSLSCRFDVDKPSYIMGFGNGGSIASYFAATYHHTSIRGLILVNPLSYVDSNYASIIHDCRNIFSCSPAMRPDLPVYFYARFLFSDKYLSKVTAPLALNLFTAINNPISLEGRINLCAGVLNNVDVRPLIQSIVPPIISVHGKDSMLVRSFHAESFLTGRKIFKTIFQALNFEGRISSTVIIMADGGHDLIQEANTKVLSLMEQLLTGYHEKKEKKLSDYFPSESKECDEAKNLDDLVLDAVSMHTPLNDTHKEDSRFEDGIPYVQLSPEHLHIATSISTKKVRKKPKSHKYNKPDSFQNFLVLNPRLTTFDKPEKTTQNPKNATRFRNSASKLGREEYMSWRLRRNKKRLSRFQHAARIIQMAFRRLLAKSLLGKLRMTKSALTIQRVYRGRLGRLEYLNLAKQEWAARFVQRAYRGSIGRYKSYDRRIKTEAQARLARIWRGTVARRVVRMLIKKRTVAATHLQSLWRRYRALNLALLKRKRRYHSILIQRIYRGHRGRKITHQERDKFLFSQSQSSGIQLGRQMLAEHKIQAVKLQSELNTLDRERSTVETCIDDLLVEIHDFEQTVDGLDEEMHHLNIAERESSSILNNNKNYEIRDRKIRLDKKFCNMITKISERKERLREEEEKLKKISKSRDYKLQEMKTLERKLVFLLEAQETELNEIRCRQKKIEMVSLDKSMKGSIVNDADELGKHAYTNHASNHEKRKVSQLMNSTETMMKFGFMSMSMTYFSSLNMVRAMKTVTTDDKTDPTINGLSEDSSKKPLAESKSHHKLENSMIDSGLTRGKQMVDPKLWGVEDVAKWLSSLNLGQHIKSFQEGAIDGPFLCQLTDEDLKNTLGVEHKLHRKKILFNVDLLLKANKSPPAGENNKSEVPNEEVFFPLNNNDLQKNEKLLVDETTSQTQSKDKLDYNKSATSIEVEDHSAKEKVTKLDIIPSIGELMTWARNHKLELIKKVLNTLPDKKMDPCDIRVQYTKDIGTSYIDMYEAKIFTLNKVDEHGNTLLHIAAQNGNLPLAKILVKKGANPNHQNNQGQTPGHFAVAYKFYDFASWLFDENGAMADDMLMNVLGFGPYDGLNE